ncbi:Serine/threonine-protein kinase PknB [Phycisphaerales bacterium]|nr:Serine/threonine-protein kinase PknB [Phycisphaerales bacterium]
MASADWTRVKEVFHAASALPADEREAFVAHACAENSALRVEVKSLLDAADPELSIESAPATVHSPTAIRGGVLEREGDRVGPYKLLQLIGEGGFGLVYMAEQETPVRRKVALKIVKPGMDTRSVIARFEQERQALAMMDHPNIAKVLDAGQTGGGRPYFVMELVRGVPITEYCDANHLSLRERVRLFTPVCQAVQHAHTKGVIHRDIKPSNLLVTLHDGTPVPKVIDFGVAKAVGTPLTDKTLFTEFRQFIGTPEYMAPEQAVLGGLDIDTRADIYSLGVVLYELLTGATPLDGTRLRSAALDELQRMIRDQDPPRMKTRLSTLKQTAVTIASARATDVTTLRRQVAGELDWVVMRALERDRTRRYESAGALAADLLRFLDNRPVEAGPPSTMYRVRKHIARNKLAFGTAGAILGALVLGLGAAVFGLVSARQDRDAAREAQRREAQQRAAADAATRVANARAEEARREAYRAGLAAAAAALEQNNGAVARQMLARAPEGLRGWEWKHLSWLTDQSLASFNVPAGSVRLFPMPDNRRLLVFPVGARPMLVDLDTGRTIKEIDTRGEDADLSPDGRLLAILSEHALSVVEIASGRTLWRHPTPAAPAVKRMLSGFTADSRAVGAVLLSDSCVELLDAETGDSAGTIRTGGPIRLARILRPDSLPGQWRMMYIDERLRRAHVYSPETGEQGPLPFPVFHEVSRSLVAAGDTFHTDIYEVDPPRIVAVARFMQGRGASAYAMTRDHRRLATLDEAGSMTLWEMDSGDKAMPKVSLAGLQAKGEAIAFTPDGRRVIGVDNRGNVKVWAVASVPAPPTVSAATTAAAPMSAALSPDSRVLVTSYWGTMEAWDTQICKPLWRRSLSPWYISAAAASPDGRYFAGAVIHPGRERESDPALRDLFVLDAATGRTVAEFNSQGLPPREPPWSAPCRSLEFSRDGERLWLGCIDGSVHVLEAASWSPAGAWPARDLCGPFRFAGTMRLSPDGSTLALAGSEESGSPPVGGVMLVDVRDPASPRHVGGFELTSAPVSTLAWERSSGAIVTGGSDGAVCVLGVASRSVRWRVDLAPAPISTVAFSPDGSRIAAAALDGNLYLLDAATGESVIVFRTWVGSTALAEWTSDGSALVLSGARATLRRLESAPPGGGDALDVLLTRDVVQQAQRVLADFQLESGSGARRLINRVDAAPSMPDGVREAARAHVRALGEATVYAVNGAISAVGDHQTDLRILELAAERCEDALATDPTYPGLSTGLGLLRLEQGRFKEAEELFRSSEQYTAARGRGSRPLNLIGFACVQALTNRPQEAQVSLERALEEGQRQSALQDPLFDRLRRRAEQAVASSR